MCDSTMSVTNRRFSLTWRDQGSTWPLSLLLLPTRLSDPRSSRDQGRITYPTGTKVKHQRIWHKPRAKRRCLGLLCSDQPDCDIGVDVSGPPSFSPLTSLPMLEADPHHRTGTPTPNNTPHIQGRDRLLPD